MKNNKLNESLNRMKLLMEFTYKTHQNDSVEEMPVKFNEIGDKYKSKPKSSYPSYEEYLDEVVLDEADPVDDNQNPPPAEPQATPPVDNNTPPPAPVEAPPAPQNAPQAPIPDASMQQPPIAPPAPTTDTMVQQPSVQVPLAPAPPVDAMSQATGLDNANTALETKMSELLMRMSDIDQKLTSVQDVSQQLNHVAQEVESIKNPSLQDQIDTITDQSYPYNISLKDYWNDTDTDEKPEETEFTASSDELGSLNKDDIKKAFTISEQKHISDLK